MVNTVRVNVNQERDFHPLADHMTKLRNCTKGEIFHRPFSLQLMFDETLSNYLIVCLVISQKLHKRVAQDTR